MASQVSRCGSRNGAATVIDESIRQVCRGRRLLLEPVRQRYDVAAGCEASVGQVAVSASPVDESVLAVGETLTPGNAEIKIKGWEDHSSTIRSDFLIRIQGKNIY